MAPGNAAVAAIDLAFVQSKEHRSKQSYTYYDRVPVIDLSPLQSQSYSDIHAAENSLEKLVLEVGKACKEWGFFVVINHGIPTDLIRKVRSAAAEFYALPLKEKRKVRRDEQNPLGYFDNELTENVRDWREVFTFVSGERVQLPADSDPLHNHIQTLHNKWPENPPQLRESCERYAEAVEKLSFSLFELISRSLGLEARRLNEYFCRSSSFVRLNYYPAYLALELALGVGRHKDGGGLTVLSHDHDQTLINICLWYCVVYNATQRAIY